jgi:hypothetical protein
MANSIVACTGLTGGGTGDLNVIDGNRVVDGAMALVINPSGLYSYRLNATSGAAESVPHIISPLTNAGNKRWELQAILPLAVIADYIDFRSEYDNGTVSSDTTIDWSNGNNQVVTLGADITLSFANMGVGHKQLRVVQDGTGGRTPTLPSGLWPGGSPGSFSSSAGAVDILSIYHNGVTYYYQLATDWA